jgi:hypothetical protein
MIRYSISNQQHDPLAVGLTSIQTRLFQPTFLVVVLVMSKEFTVQMIIVMYEERNNCNKRCSVCSEKERGPEGRGTTCSAECGRVIVMTSSHPQVYDYR